jgi:hypothetical protein
VIHSHRCCIRVSARRLLPTATVSLEPLIGDGGRRPSGGHVACHGSEEVVPVERKHSAGLGSSHRGRARHASEQGDLAEPVAPHHPAGGAPAR